MNLIKYKSPLGVITIQEHQTSRAVARVYLPNAEPVDVAGAGEQSSPLLENAKTQLEEYFAGKRKVFDLPLDFDGCTDFMRAVYCALLEIPYGETAAYKNIAERIGCPKGYRAVGLANNKNPLPVIIPCHRVIGLDGKPSGFAGGADMKIKLLELEKNQIKSENQ